MSERDDYLLFAGHKYYPDGGVLDYRISGSIEECKAYFLKHAKCISGKSYVDNWGQIVDSKTFLICLLGSCNDQMFIEWKEGPVL